MSGFAVLMFHFSSPIPDGRIWLLLLANGLSTAWVALSLLFEVHAPDMENYLMREVASELLHCSQVLSTQCHWYHNWRLESFPKFGAVGLMFLTWAQ